MDLVARHLGIVRAIHPAERRGQAVQIVHVDGEEYLVEPSWWSAFEVGSVVDVAWTLVENQRCVLRARRVETLGV